MDELPQNKSYECIVIGGGIAGVSCVETISILEPSLSTLLISGSPLVKVATGVRQLTKTIEEFDVEERPFDWVESRNANLQVILGEVLSVMPKEHIVRLTDGREFSYGILCVCSGGKPKIIAANNPHVIGIRDTETVQDFIRKLKDSKRIMIVGNGGIATEMVWELEGVEVIWAVKDSSISAAFVDAGAAEFFLNVMKDQSLPVHQIPPEEPSKRLKYTNTASISKVSSYGSALGPDWAVDLLMKGKSELNSPPTIEYNCEVCNIYTKEDYAAAGKLSSSETWPVYVELTNGKAYGCDFIVSATGVIPNVDFLRGTLPENAFAEDGGIKVKENMESFVDDIFVAGDACSVTWKPAFHWFQMRLWTQARQMGAYSAKCMLAKLRHEQDISLDFAFELFGHATRFFGFKVVLLGLFNGQRLGTDYEILLRMTKGVEFVKVIVKDGTVHGAVFIGNTDLEETFENLILNGTDVTSYGEDLLNPDIDIEDYFD